MNQELVDSLILGETDIDGALQRLCGDKKLYCLLLTSFLKDRTMEQLGAAIEAESWDKAFTAAHALKGLAGNLGFVPLFHSVGELVVLIRSGKIGEVAESFNMVEHCYNDIVYVINSHMEILNNELGV